MSYIVLLAQKKVGIKNQEDLCRQLSGLVQEAHTALADLRSHNAQQAFSRALDLLETCTPKVRTGLHHLKEAAAALK